MTEEQKQKFVELMEEVKEERNASRNSKDSVFKDLFGRREYAAALIRAVHPDWDFSEEELTIVTLKNVLVNQEYNDLGVLLRKEHLFLFEAQSTFSLNILPRMMIYAAMTIRSFVTLFSQNLYGSRKIEFPKMEFYVIYTGDQEINESISLSEAFYGGETFGVEIIAKVISAGQPGDVVDQYIQFARIRDETMKEYGRTQEAVRKLIARCETENVLRDYLREIKNQEVGGLMSFLFDEKYFRELYYEEVREEGREEGRKEGRQELLVSLVEKGKLPLKVAAEEMNETKEDFSKRLWRG